MTRAGAREIAIQLCFSGAVQSGNSAEVLESFFEKDYYKTLKTEGFEEYPSNKQREYIRAVVLGVEEHRDEIDAYIEKYSKGWKVSRISKTALAVLRVAMFESLYVSDVPIGVAINEAVELAKGFDMPETVSFINGVLGSFSRKEEEEPTEIPEEDTIELGEDDSAEDEAESEPEAEIGTEAADSSETADEEPIIE